MAKKEVTQVFKIMAPGGAATPAPPLGPVLGSKGVNPGQFIQKFNAATQHVKGKVVGCIVTVYNDRTFDFDVGRDALWDALTDTSRYPNWWPWLRKFDAPGLTPGTVAHCAVRAPLPYTLEFSVHVQAVEVGHAVDTEVRGDLSGPARLVIDGNGAATSTARLTWEVELRVPMLSAVSRVARPVLVWAHDQIVASGVEGFRRNALDR